MNLQLPIHSYQRRDVGGRLVNCYAEQTSIGAKAPVALVGAPGVANWVTVGDGPIRGVRRFDGVLYVVSAKKLYSVARNATVTEIGTIDGVGDVLMSSNRSELVIVANSTYIYDKTTLSTVTDPDYRGASAVDFIDGFMLFVEPDSDRFYASAIGDASDYDALDFATAESSPDKLVGLIVDHRQIVLAGEDTTEIWWNAGNAGFPFERIPSGTLETGCSAGLSLAKADNTVFWLDDERIVRALRDLTPQRVSQHGVEEAFQSYTTVSDARAFTFTEEGHIFYVLTFPTERKTWVYDVTTQEWHERESLGSSRWDVDHYARVYNQHIVAKQGSNQLGIMSSRTYTEFGQPMRSLWTYPPIFADANNVRHSLFEIVARRGVGDDEAALISLELSDDGGRTWFGMPIRDVGKIGEYRARTQWHRLGSSRHRSYRCSMSDDALRYIESTQVRADGGQF